MQRQTKQFLKTQLTFVSGEVNNLLTKKTREISKYAKINIFDNFIFSDLIK